MAIRNRYDDKVRIIQIVKSLRKRSHLKKLEIVKRMQEMCPIDELEFENLFTTRRNRLGDIPSQYIIALIRVFTSKEIEEGNRCTIDEAIELIDLTRLPLSQFVEIESCFPPGRLREAVLACFSQDSSNLPLVEIDFGIIPLPGVLIGRDELLRNIRAALDTPSVVSLCGLGGVGKTVSAAKIGSEWRNDGRKVCWIDVAHKTDSDELYDAIGMQLGIQDVGQVKHQQKLVRIQKVLEDNQIDLLILDDLCLRNPNKEDAIWELARRLPYRCRLLLTSRARIKIDYSYDLNSFSKANARKLFCYYAEMPATEKVDDLCAFLGNHPMAIRIAATLAYKQQLTVDELWNMLVNAGNPLKKLSLGDEVYTNVWSSLWVSYEQLSPHAQTLLKTLGALWKPVATAELLALASGLEKSDTDKLLDDLFNLGLVERGSISEGVERYWVHELVAQFTIALLKEKEEKDFEACQYRALDAYRIYVQHHAEQNAQAHQYLEAEKENLLAAADWAAAHQRWSDANELALDLCFKSQFLIWRNYVGSIRLLTSAVEAAQRLASQEGLDSAEVRSRRRDQGIHQRILGWTYYGAGQWEKALELYRQAMEVSRETQDMDGVVRCLINSGVASIAGCKYDEALDYLEQARQLAEHEGQKRNLNWILGNMAIVWHIKGEWDQALKSYQAALELAYQVDDIRSVGEWMGGIGNVLRESGRPAEAVSQYERARQFVHEKIAPNGAEEAKWLGGLGEALKDLGELERAIACHEEALAMDRSVAHRVGEGNHLGDLGRVYIVKKDWERAEKYTLEALSIHEKLKLRRPMSDWLFNLGTIAEARWTERGNTRDPKLLQQAAEYYEEAAKIRDQIADNRLAEVKTALERVNRKLSELL